MSVTRVTPAWPRVANPEPLAERARHRKLEGPNLPTPAPKRWVTSLRYQARREEGLGVFFLCQSSVVKIIALVLKQKTILRVGLVSASVATRSLH